MGFYPPEIRDGVRALLARAHGGGANCAGTSAAFQCGSFVRFRLMIDGGSKTVLCASVESNGCGYMLAAAEVVAGYLTGKALTGLNGIDRRGLCAETERRLGGFPDSRLACRDACFEALAAALGDFRSAQLEEFRGETALVCTCFGVSEGRIEALIAEGSVLTVEDVGRSCGAGTGCGSCRMVIEEMIDGKGA